MEENHEGDEDGGGNKEKAEAACGKDDMMMTMGNPVKTRDAGGQTKDAPVNGIVVVGGRKICKHCGSSLED